MRVKHPYALDDDGPSPDGAVHWGGRREWSEVDADGTFYVPDDKARNFVERWPEAAGYDPDDLLIAENGQRADSGEGSDEATDWSESDFTPLCDGTTAAGEPCTREVDEPGGYCYQHGPEDDGE